MRHETGATSLELHQDLEGQRREWRFERAGWFIFGVVIVAAFAGLFGGGPPAHETARSALGGASAEYDRVLRFGNASTISVTLAPRGPSDTVAVLALHRSWLGSVELQHVSPEPFETIGADSLVLLRFRRLSGTWPIVVDFSVAPMTVGRLDTRVITDSGSLLMPQLVLP